jgi:RNA polymerase sigma-70 factor (ECF subfamily)
MSTAPTEFEDRVAPFRRELLAHCYRMTGSLSDAEDALQDSLLRAWRGLSQFEGRSSLRTWLYRVTTNACLDLLAERRGRSLPHLVHLPGASDAAVAQDLEPVWLEPFPDAWLEDDPETRPDAIYARREATRLAFIAALQRLPARQRAILILRDVVALSAEESATTLGITVATANSLLQRARATLEAQPYRRPVPTDPDALRELLARFLSAWERGDPEALIAVLARDAISSMPPATLWLQGTADIVAFMAAKVWPRGRFRLLPCAVNDAPAFAVYLASGGDPPTLMSLTLLEIDGGTVSAFHSFMAAAPRFDPARYLLAATLTEP